jgi:3-oxosteroid 1-dehydrogenase
MRKIFRRGSADAAFLEARSRRDLAGEQPTTERRVGDASNPNLGPVDRPPYYGVRLRLGGASSAGLMTNTNAQVMRVRGQPIARLYASGNAAACTDFGAAYQAGESLARGMTWSYLAIRDMASR